MNLVIPTTYGRTISKLLATVLFKNEWIELFQATAGSQIRGHNLQHEGRLSVHRSSCSDDGTHSGLRDGARGSLLTKKKLSVVSGFSLTPTTPRSLERVSVSPLTRVGSLSQMVLTVHDFVTALDGFVPVSLRGLPLHTARTVDFSHVAENTSKIRETFFFLITFPSSFFFFFLSSFLGVRIRVPTSPRHADSCPDTVFSMRESRRNHNARRDIALKVI